MTLRNLLRIRHGREHSRVTSVELFFDLVFVFAVTQISHYLLHDLSAHGILRAAVLLMAVWWVWMYTSWATNWLDPDTVPVKLMLFAAMLAGLVMSAAIPEAFAGRGAAFGIAIAVIQLGRTAFLTFVARRERSLFLNLLRVVTWTAVSSLFWVSGGFVEGERRLALWLIAILIDYGSPWFGFWMPGLGRSTTSDWTVEVHHMAERCGLFIIIALGESILVMGASFSELEWTGPVVGAFLTSFLASVAMWWIYFTTADAGDAILSHSDDPGRLARSAYTFMHLPMVAGIIVAAVGDELVLTHPLDHGEPEAIAAVLGGPALYLLGTTLFKLTLWRRLSIPGAAGLVALAALVPVAAGFEPLLLSAVTTAILLAIGVWDARSGRGTAGRETTQTQAAADSA